MGSHEFRDINYMAVSISDDSAALLNHENYCHAVMSEWVSEWMSEMQNHNLNYNLLFHELIKLENRVIH